MSEGLVIRWGAAEAAALLRVPGPESHKYSRGVLGLRTGSSAYPGAAVLGAEAAWRTGIGSVRYFSPLDDPPPSHGLPTPAAAILAARPETVCSGDGGEDRARCDAWLLGSGTDPRSRSFAEREALRSLLAGDSPVVVDAGALELVARRPSAPVVVTPHLGEFRTLWRSSGLGETPDRRGGAGGAGGLAEAASRLAAHLGVTVLLKGSLTIAAPPEGRAIASGPATPWLSTAGTGDVLAGILGALVAAHAREVESDPGLLAPLGATAALLHDTAARHAAGDPDGGGEGGPVTALDVARAVGAAFRQLRD